MSTTHLQKAPSSEIQDALRRGAVETIGKVFEQQHPAEIADALEALPLEQRHAVWSHVPTAAKGDVLTEVHGDVRQRLIAALDQDELLGALQGLDMDQLADLDVDLPESTVEAVVQRMDAEQRKRYDAVKEHPDDTAGGLMDADAAAVLSEGSLSGVQRQLRELRQRHGQLPEHMDSVVVVDQDDVYLGVLHLSDVVSLSGDVEVMEAMDGSIPAFPATTPAQEVAGVFADRDLVSAAVVDSGDRVVGRITVDDVVDVLREETEREIMSRAGLPASTDTFEPVLSSAARRAVWLGVNLINALIAAWVIGLFEASIDQIVALAVLMPVVASMGGVAGNQTLTLVTRGLALDQISGSNALELLRRELASGMLNGLLWAVVVGVVAVLWFADTRLGLVFGLALIINLLTGAIAGTLVPLALQRLGIDPALAGGVLLVAATDVVGFMSFLGLATLTLL
jgi:magnesium transporter